MSTSRRRGVLLLVGACVLVAVLGAVLVRWRTVDAVFEGAGPPDGWVSNEASGVRATRIASLGELATGLGSDPSVSVLFIATRFGRVISIPVEHVEGRRVPKPSEAQVEIDMSESISFDGERGLLGLQVLDADRVAISFTDHDGAVTVKLLRIEGTHLVDDVDRPVVLAVPHAFAGHNGGGLALGAAGDLYVSIGDMDLRELALPAAQDPTSLLGGVVRIPAIALRDDSARPVEPSPSILVAKGLRNPWRISTDAADDSLWIGDVGQDATEEVDVIRDVDSVTSPVDFGWPVLEGTAPFRTDLHLAPGSIAPVLELAHDDTTCSISLGGVYDGRSVPALSGRLVLGDMCSGEVSATDVDRTPVRSPTPVAEVSSGVVSFGRDADGEMYALTLEGDVYRLDPGNWRPPDATTRVNLPPAATQPEAVRPNAPSTEECAVVDYLLAMIQFRDLTSDEVRAGLQRLNASLDAAVVSADADRRPSLERLQLVFADFTRLAESVGYDPSAPEAAALIAELVGGTGRGEGFPEAITAVMNGASSCG